MTFPRITSSQFESKLKASVLKRDRTADVTIGPILDWMIRPQAALAESQQDSIRRLFQLLGLSGLDQLDPSDVDAFAANERLVRSNGSAAFLDLTFSRASKPQTDITIPANFPVATEIDSSSGRSTTFLTQQTATLLAASADAYYNTDTGRYELTIPAASLNAGPSTRVSRLRVTKPLRPLPGFDSVTNKTESSGGLAAESNQVVGDRYLLRIQGTDVSTSKGQQRLARQVFANVEDCLVVSGNDPFLTRADTDAGAVDIYILGESVIERTITVAFPGRLNPIVLDRQPVVDILSVSSGVVYAPGVDFDLVYDATDVSHSKRSKDAVVFRSQGAAPALGDPLIISYRYDNLILALQSLFEQPIYRSQAADVLFRRSTRVEVSLSLTIKPLSGDPDAILAGATQAILTFFNGNESLRGLAQGASVEQFDINALLSRLGGIDNVTYTLLARAGQTGVTDLAMLPNEYARIRAANLNISLA